MSKTRTVVIALAVIAPIVAAPISAGAGARPEKYSSCAALQKKYPGGIAVSKAKKKGTSAFVSAALYNQNKSLDLDKDGIACDAGDTPPSEWTGTTLSGNGSEVKDVSIPKGKVVTIKFTHSGTDAFIVNALDANESQIGQLVNASGSYSGTVFVARGDESEPAETKSLDIVADGAWTAKVSLASNVPVLTGSKSGQGDAVLRYKGAKSTFTVTREDDVNVSVTIYTTKGYYADVPDSSDDSDVDTYEIPADCYVAITADGEWTISK